MPVIILRDIEAVGMHHWSHRKLQKGEYLLLKREPSNPVDPNAVALLNPTSEEKLAYCGWSDAKRLTSILQDTRVVNRDKVLAVVTGNWEVVMYEQGPRQTINVALNVEENHASKLLHDVTMMGIPAYIKSN